VLALIVSGYGPSTVVGVLQTVSVEEPAPLIEGGEKELVEPSAGSPLRLRVRLLLNPLTKAEIDTV
jgi:hypothetical protein